MACFELLSYKTLHNLPSEIRREICYTIQSHDHSMISFIGKLLNVNNIEARVCMQTRNIMSTEVRAIRDFKY